MKILDTKFVRGFIKMAEDGFQQGWHERNGGNLSYRLKREEVEEIKNRLNDSKDWEPIGARVPGLAGEYFLVTGSGKYFRNIMVDPESSIAIIELDDAGENYRIRWGLVEGGRPTSELPAHLMNHEVKKEVTGGNHRVIYHAHTTNIIALTFVLPLKDEIFTRELWESATECPVVFPDGVGVVPWMVPGGEEIAVETSKLMRRYDVAIWAHHGMFVSAKYSCGFSNTLISSIIVGERYLNYFTTITEDRLWQLLAKPVFRWRNRSGLSMNAAKAV